MARHRADKPEDDLDDLEADDELDTEDTGAAEESVERPAEVEKFWEKVGVDPVEIALPRGVGYTLRAYRMSDTLAEDEPELDDEAERTEAETAEAEEAAAEAPAAAAAGKPAAEKPAAKTSAAAKPAARKRVDESVPEDVRDADEDLDELDDEERDRDELDDADRDPDELDEDELDEGELDEEEAEAAAPQPEEVPLFLTQDRQLLLFRTAEGLAAFVLSGEANDMQAIDEWETLRSELTADQVVVAADDRYELDLVVENLRGGHDAWEAELLIKAGELCRDLGHALRIESVVTALSPGSPLDDLDEALRTTETGRLGAFFGRRKLRRIGAQQAALAWRSIIGKISTSVDWRD